MCWQPFLIGRSGPCGHGWTRLVAQEQAAPQSELEGGWVWLCNYAGLQTEDACSCLWHRCRRAALELQALCAAQAQAVVALVSAGNAAAAAGQADPEWPERKWLVLLAAVVQGATPSGVAMDPALEAALESAWSPLAQVRAAANSPCIWVH